MRELTTEELNARLLDPTDRFWFLDVRPTEDYAECHIAGALSVPVDTLEEWAREHLKDRLAPVVVYGSQLASPRAAEAERILERRLGMEDVARYLGGLAEWREGHLPLDAGEERSIRPEERPHRANELPAPF
ncbi:MAG: rhodanese-like domain-containing protein [Myxococcales bacterium]